MGSALDEDVVRGVDTSDGVLYVFHIGIGGVELVEEGWVEVDEKDWERDLVMVF